MILITGDTHGDFDRFGKKELRRLKRNDALIICGDFGFIWDGSKKEKKILKKIGKKRYNVLFVEGVHENFTELDKYETEYWCGGLTRKISGNLRQLIRGEIFEIAGKRIFAFGGGTSEENDAYLNCTSEQPDDRLKHELPSDEELNRALKNIADNSGQVDFVVSYDPPAKISEFLTLGKTDRTHINTFLDDVSEKAEFKTWFFGRYHLNKLIPTKYQAVFDKIVEADISRIKNRH